MLRGLRLDTTGDYYACEEHFDSEAISHGKRRRWAQMAKLNVSVEDVEVDEDIVRNIVSDHGYSKCYEYNEEEYIEPVDLNMGTDFFLDSNSISCVEETVASNTSESVMEESSQESDTLTESQGESYSQTSDFLSSQETEEVKSEGFFSKAGFVLVSWVSLLGLVHRKCLSEDCEAMVIPEETRISYQGAAVSIHMCCTSNHINIWHSSEFYSKKTEKGRARSKLNVQLATYILCTGMQFSPVEVKKN